MVQGYDPKGPIFISYRRSDGHDYAELLDYFLRAAGLVPWRDLVDLPPGETVHRVVEAFEEGISNALLIVTPDLKESKFVPETELPKLRELDSDPASPFRLLVLNTMSAAGTASEIDVAAPDRVLRTDGLIKLKQYALLSSRMELRQTVADLLEARMAARVDHLKDKEIMIQLQTRPAGTARSRLSGTDRSSFVSRDKDDPYDLTVRLRQDSETAVPSELSLLALKQTLPLMVDAMYGHGVERVRLAGGGHYALPWAVGAALPTTRMGNGSVSVQDIDRNCWDETGQHDAKTYGVVWNPEIDAHIPDDKLTRAAVLLQFEDRVNVRAFKKMADDLPECYARLTASVRRVGPGNGRRIPASEGARIASEILGELRKVIKDTGIDELHIVNALPVPIAAFCGRQSNTLNVVLYEWGTSWETGNRRYLPLVRVQPGMPNGPITEVFPQRRFSWNSEEVTELVNLTPHDVNLVQEGRVVRCWDAATEEEWCRVGQQIGDPTTVTEQGINIPVHIVTPENVVNEPPRVSGRAYIVPRLTAAASSRDDFLFPIRETRDEHGRVNGAEGLGKLPASEDSAARWLGLLSKPCQHCGRPAPFSS